MSDLEVALEALRSGARDFFDGSDHVGAAMQLISSVQINPQALGEVDAAQEFASALATFVGTHGDDLRHGSGWVAGSASELVASADDYHRTEQAEVVNFNQVGDAL